MTDLELFKKMLRIRIVEETIAEEYKKQEMRCAMHISIGQEAGAVGVCEVVKKSDYVYSSHRAHNHYLAKGGNLINFIAELYGKSEGCSGGRGGSMHLIDLAVNFMGSTPIVGGTVPLAAGSAWYDKLKGNKNITALFIGDGCFEEGVVHETMNFASLHNLPLLIICENNNFSVFTSLQKRQSNLGIYKVAEAHGLFSQKANGNDLHEVIDATRNAIDVICNQNKPAFIEFETYRVYEHCGPFIDDHLGYRTDPEIAEGRKNCPLNIFLDKYDSNGLIKNVLEDLSMGFKEEVDAAIAMAKSFNPPNINIAGKNLYAKNKKS